MAPGLFVEKMSEASSSTLGAERRTNWAFKEQTKEEFIEEILKDQPFVPADFSFNVDLNCQGGVNVAKTKREVVIKYNIDHIETDLLVIDTREEEKFKRGHLPGNINIMARSDSDKYETWLGSIVAPREEFFLVIESINKLDEIWNRIAKIGYEKQLKAIIILSNRINEKFDELDFEDFRKNESGYTIVDIRNENELARGNFFSGAYHIPLNELRDRYIELPRDKPFVVHCAGGYRSTAGSSILKNIFLNPEYMTWAKESRKLFKKSLADKLILFN